MTYRSLVFCLVLAGCTVLFATARTLAQQSRGPATERDVIENGWLRSYSEGLELARATGKPLMVLARCVP